MSGLNPAQRAAVRYLGGPLLVLAGAGSGKTRVITQKIAYLIKECGIEARHIAEVTFTNKAAREMKGRVAELMAGKEAKGLQVSTFHTLGLNILRRELAALGYRPGFSIFDAEDSASLLRELMRREFNDDSQVSNVQWQISRWKGLLLDPAQAMAAADGAAAQVMAAGLYAQYQRHLKAYNAVDFDDLILLPALLFRDRPDILGAWQNRIRYLLVDEYQDTNGSQYHLVRALVGVRGALTVVGDDDQSIYAWRGAAPESLALLQEDFPNLKVIKLEQNYRSAGRILKAANQLIANNPHVFEKKLWSELGYGAPLRVIETRSDEHEAEAVVSEILSHKFKHRTDYRDYAILYRGNHQARLFEKTLREQRIPYYLSGGASFFSHTEVRDLMAYLRLLVNPDDDSAFLRVVNVPRREIGPSTLEKLADYASGRGVSLFTACFELGLRQQLSERAAERLEYFANWLTDLGSHMSLMDILLRGEEENKNDCEHLLTLHAAKGLEFPHVFLVGMEEEYLPHRSSIEEGKLEEERRLAYVGMTRARKTLTFTLAAKRKRGGDMSSREPSRFLQELPADDLQWEGGSRAVDPEQRQQRGQAHLANLRNVLGNG